MRTAWEYLGMVARPNGGRGWFEAHRCTDCGHLELLLMESQQVPFECVMCRRLKRLEADLDALQRRLAR